MNQICHSVMHGREAGRWGAIMLLLGCALPLSLLSTRAEALPFPVDGNNDFTANIIRRYDNGVLLSSITQSASTNATLQLAVSRAIDGGRGAAQWSLPGGASDPTASATLRITLDQSYDIGRLYHIYHSPIYLPASYEFRLSNTGFVGMTTVATNNSPAKVNNDIIAPFTAQYLEYQWTGGGGLNPFVLLSQIEAFSDAGGPALSSNGGWNVIALQTSAPIVATKLTPGNWQGDNVNNVVDLNLDDPSYLRGNGAAGNALFSIDLGNMHLLESVNMGFYHGQPWGSGTQIELSRDGVNFTSVFDSNVSTGESLNVVFTPQTARYIRVTNKNSSSNALAEFQVFADALPVLAESPLTGSTINVGSGIAFETVTLSNAITLTNVGEMTSELLVLSYSISGLDAAIFDVPDFLPTTLTVGGVDSVQFDLEATLGAVGFYNNAVLTINTNVGDIVLIYK